MLGPLRRYCLPLLAALGVASLLGNAFASQVTIERIIVQPDYSASSANTYPDLGPNGEDSGRSGVTLDGKQRSLSPNIGADGYPNDNRDLGPERFGPPPSVLSLLRCAACISPF